MSLKCSACGEENPDKAVVCEMCQASLRSTPSLSPAAAKLAGKAASKSIAPAIPSQPPAATLVPRATPTPVAAESARIIYIPAAAPRRGRGGLIAAALGGAAVALVVVAAKKPTQKPQTSATDTSSTSRSAFTRAPVEVPPPARIDKTPLVLGEMPRAPEAEPVPAAAPPAAQPAASAEPVAKRSQQIIVRYHGQDARTQRILVPVTVNGSATVMMALDTGAPSTLITYGLANHLGVLRSEDGALLTSVGGIGGSAPAVLVVLDSLGLGDARDEFVPATVTAALSDSFEGLLGMDFITTFQLRVDTVQQVLILTKPVLDVKTPAGHDEHWWRRLFSEFHSQRSRWDGFRQAVDKRLGDSMVSEGPSIERLRRLQAIAVNQAEEANKLLQRLERHASNHSVPREWR